MKISALDWTLVVIYFILALAQLRQLKFFLLETKAFAAPKLLFFRKGYLKMACSEDLPS